MSVRVKIPTLLRKFSHGAGEAHVEGDSVATVLERLDALYPGIRSRLYDETGAIRPFVNLYVNGEDIRFLDGLLTPLHPGDELAIVPAVAGGASCSLRGGISPVPPPSAPVPTRSV